MMVGAIPIKKWAGTLAEKLFIFDGEGKVICEKITRGDA